MPECAWPVAFIPRAVASPAAHGLGRELRELRGRLQPAVLKSRLDRVLRSSLPRQKRVEQREHGMGREIRELQRRVFLAQRPPSRGRAFQERDSHEFVLWMERKSWLKRRRQLQLVLLRRGEGGAHGWVTRGRVGRGCRERGGGITRSGCGLQRCPARRRCAARGRTGGLEVREKMGGGAAPAPHW